MRIALVYDRVNKMGGAERVLLALHELWPDAPLFTSVYDEKGAPWARSFNVRTTFLQHIPFAKRHHEWFAWAMPFAFGTFVFDDYDAVISVTSAEAKDIITKPETRHICYCLTPTRYLWSGKDLYQRYTGFGMFHEVASWAFSHVLPTLQHWDIIGSRRPDVYIGISKRVQQRIRRYYQQDAVLVYPPVDTDFFVPAPKDGDSESYYLVVSRLVPYKRLDIIIRAFSELGKKLVVIGSGSQERELRRMAGGTVQFITRNLTELELLGYYQHCRAFIFSGDEDFGLAAAEAQSCGIPVIAYKQSGVAEIVKDGKTGLLFSNQSVRSLKKTLRRFDTMTFYKQTIRSNALRFAKKVFHKKMKYFIERQMPIV